ncbi:MAG: murein biosynthesis integral rane protein MurJ [Actinomycetia bacterium]|nr:murein biosynthesis integral rane protein MurJ [Actinomycetes bacterium]
MSDVETTGGRSRLLRSSAVVGLGTAISRLTGFGRVAALAYALGFTRVTDTYNLANETPNMVYELLLGGVLTATFLPLFVQYFERDDDDSTSAVLTVSVVFLVLLTIAGIVAAPWIVRLYTIQVHGATRVAQRHVATNLLRWFMPQMFFYGITALATSLLNARRRFAAPAFAPILNNVVVIAIFLSIPHIVSGPLTLTRLEHDYSLIVLLGLGTTAGIAAMALVLLPPLWRAGVRLHWKLQLRHPAVRRVISLSGWTFGYVATNQVALWVVLVLANGRVGGVSAYLGAYVFFQLPHGLLAVSIITTVAPELASAVTRNDFAELRERFAVGLRLTIAVVLPAAIGFIALSRPLVAGLLQRGAFSSASAASTSRALAGFAVGLVAFSVYLFTLRLFYSMQDTRTPFLINLFENAANIVLALALFPAFGVTGLALAFSGAYILAAVLALFVARRRLGSLDLAALGIGLPRIFLASAVSGFIAWVVAEAIGWSDGLRALEGLFAGGTTFVVVMVVTCVVLRVPEVAILKDALLRRSPTARGV